MEEFPLRIRRVEQVSKEVASRRAVAMTLGRQEEKKTTTMPIESLYRLFDCCACPTRFSTLSSPLNFPLPFSSKR